jgi:ketosteroid isomerase-like protein
MLGAWQLGDIEKLHKDYGDDVVVVNGAWAPPVIGWTNYLTVYQQQRTRMQQVRMDRSNTYITVRGNVAWACYQWDFAGLVDGQPASSQGQTTVVLEKRNNHWVIVHNHTSQAPAPPANPPAAKPEEQPAKPPQP